MSAVATATVATADALSPLRAALLAAAGEQAAGILRAAQREVAALLADAGVEQSNALADARAAGRADVSAELSRRRIEARRGARHTVLAAQRQAYDALRGAARAAVRDLLADPARRDALAAAGCARLGVEPASANVREHPAGGVVVSVADGRVMDLSVPALVDDLLARLDVAALWAAPT